MAESESLRPLIFAKALCKTAYPQIDRLSEYRAWMYLKFPVSSRLNHIGYAIQAQLRQRSPLAGKF